MSQEVEAPIQQQERAETATLTHHEPHTTSINANDNTTATTDAASHVASNSQTTLQPIVVPSKQLPTTVTDSNPITKPPSSTDPNDDEQLYQFLTKLTTVKPTVPPTLTRRIMHKQGVGFVCSMSTHTYSNFFPFDGAGGFWTGTFEADRAGGSDCGGSGCGDSGSDSSSSAH